MIRWKRKKVLHMQLETFDACYSDLHVYYFVLLLLYFFISFFFFNICFSVIWNMK